MTAFGAAYLFIIAAQNQYLKTMTAFFALIFINGHVEPPASNFIKKNYNRKPLLSSSIEV
jgi:hypothetical protein